MEIGFVRLASCKAESKLQRLRAIHNGLAFFDYEDIAVKPNQNYKD